MITNYKDKKLVEYLEPGQKVLIRFGHGLGDTIMFVPIFQRLREIYSNVHFDLYLETGQEKIFDSLCVSDKEGKGYDHVFHLDFPMSEGSGLTKGQKCCIDEIGIEPTYELPQFPKYESPFVAVHFHGTALPDSVGCPSDIAEAIWNDIIEYGKIPIECHFRHVFHNPINELFPFITRHVRDCKAEIPSLIGLIQRSHAFIGVASGPFMVALSLSPHRLLYLEKNHKISDYTKLGVASINIKEGYVKGSIKQWLSSLSHREIWRVI